jgi:hypothetical protein
MGSDRNKRYSDYQISLIERLPSRYKEALETIEGAGGTVSEYALELFLHANQHGLSDEEVIKLLKNHYMSSNKPNE